jgi:hypothetical protein
MEMVRGETLTRKPDTISLAFEIGWVSPISGKIRPHD